MIDLHCHILPGVDDGARSGEIALGMCRMAAADGIRHIVATPHANFRYPYDRTRHQAALDQLHEDCGGIVELTLGCDFHLSYDNLEHVLASPHTYTIGNTDYLLVELSDFAIPTNLSRVLFNLTAAGLHPIITHPERYFLLQKRPEFLLEWINEGCLMQITANALTGFWGRSALKLARWLLERDAVHVVSSDGHDTTARPPVLSPAVKVLTKLVGAEQTQMLVAGNPGAIVRGQPLPTF
jgi:protein-tyrosine phosphatase